MPVGPFSGIVASINASQINTTVGLNALDVFVPPFNNSEGPGLVTFSLEYAHPGYSSIYTLLIASAVNKKQIIVHQVPNAAGNMEIQTVEFDF